MHRKLPIIISLVLAAAISAVVIPHEIALDSAKRDTTNFQTVKSYVSGALSVLAPSSPQASKPEESTSAGVEQRLGHARVPAMRGGHNYGWIQLPRGTPVEVIQADGESLVVRYDEAVVRMPGSDVREGKVVLKSDKPRMTKI